MYVRLRSICIFIFGALAVVAIVLALKFVGKITTRPTSLISQPQSQSAYWIWASVALLTMVFMVKSFIARGINSVAVCYSNMKPALSKFATMSFAFSLFVVV